MTIMTKTKEFLIGALLCSAICHPLHSHAQQIDPAALLKKEVTVYTREKSFVKKDLGSIQSDYIIIDFWASWCEPCIRVLHQMEYIQKEFGKKLSVIAVSGDTKDRFLSFNDAHKITTLNAIDEHNKLFSYLNIKIIPTTLFINRRLHSVSIFEGEMLSKVTVDSLMEGKHVASEKTSVSFMSEPNEVLKSFKVPDSTSQMVRETPHYPGSSSFYYKYTEPPFNSRRITFVNFSIPGLYRFAYNTTYVRYKSSHPGIKETNASEFKCYDIIVPKGDYELNNVRLALKHYLEQRHPELSASLIDSTATTCLVLRKQEGARFDNSKDTISKLDIKGPEFNGTNVPLREFINYLEEQTKLPVEDETGLTGRFNIAVKFNYENKNTLFDELKKIGFKISEEKQKKIKYILLK